MRVVLVGPAARRAGLRAVVTGGVEVVAEVTTVSEARRILGVDGYVMAPPVTEEEDAPVEPLTARELEVLAHLADGLSNKAIAVRLGISADTATSHLTPILEALR